MKFTGNNETPLNVNFELAGEENAGTVLKELKALTEKVLPFQYSDAIYQQCIMCGEVTQIARIDDRVVGAVACRLEAAKDRDGGRLYVVMLGVLPEFRSAGLGSFLLQRAILAGRCAIEVSARQHIDDIVPIHVFFVLVRKAGTSRSLPTPVTTVATCASSL